MIRIIPVLWLLSLCLPGFLAGQIALEHTYPQAAGNPAANHSRLSLIHLEISGCKYMKVNKVTQVIELFHLDHSPFKRISFQESPLVTSLPCEVLYVTQSLFDKNPRIEFLLTGTDKTGKNRTIVYDENLKVLLDEELAVPSLNQFPLEGPGPVYGTPDGTCLILDYDDGSVGVFSVPGDLPETDCGHEWVEIIAEKGSKTIIRRVDTVFLDGMQLQYRQDTLLMTQEELTKAQEIKNRPPKSVDISQINPSQLQSGMIIGLKNLRFERGSASFVRKSVSDLKKLLDIMKTHPGLAIRLEGHTDKRFDSLNNIDSNQQLSVRRVMAVRRWLVDKGIDKRRIQTKGYGGARPIESNDREETRKLNRRVEVFILSI